MVTVDESLRMIAGLAEKLTQARHDLNKRQGA
jgi:hypothetical protein